MTNPENLDAVYLSSEKRKEFHRSYLTCTVCKSKSVFKCRGCKRVFYCSREHQKLDWKNHKTHCRSRQQKESVKDSPSKKLENNNRKASTFNLCDKQSCFIDALSLQFYEDLVDFIENALETYGLCVIDNYMPDNIANKILEETTSLYKTSSMCHKDYGDNAKLYRSDYISWLPSSNETKTSVKELRSSYELLSKSFNSSHFLNKEEEIKYTSKSQFSCFPENTFGYKRHTDNPNSNGRVITAIYYLNPSYCREKDGGVTRFYFNNDKKYIDVEPKLNRSVLHWSDGRVRKETLPCNKDIFSLTTWYLNSSPNRERKSFNESYKKSNLVTPTKNKLYDTDFYISRKSHQLPHLQPPPLDFRPTLVKYPTEKFRLDTSLDFKSNSTKSTGVYYFLGRKDYETSLDAPPPLLCKDKVNMYLSRLEKVYS